MSKNKTINSRKGPGGSQAKQQPRRKLLSPDEPDVSSILKVPGTELTEEYDDVFDHPLHSTALSEEGGEGEPPVAEPDGSATNSDSEPEKKNTRQSKDQRNVKSQVKKEDSKKDPLMKNTISRTKSQRKRKRASPRMEEDDSDDPHLAKVEVPKRRKKDAKHITEYDVILDEFEKITAQYKQNVELKICRKAINSFHTAIKEHLIGIIAGAEELKNTKLKNAKMVRTTNKKRWRLVEVRQELISTEPYLKKLEREHAELQEKIASLRKAIKLVSNLKDLKQLYVNQRRKNPQRKVVYGISSLPALLVESQRILGAEGHFRKINKKLQKALHLPKKN